ncbi:MAG: Zn-ribbon domain-containing OB-fold protein [Chloroflexi bacterium]|nr:Zn-ribbon domain-containing OB-fold protein [Chloroflexota bacterium]
MVGDWDRPLPTESGETKPFWEACRRGQYLLQQCRACGKVQAYYRRFCAHCWSKDVEEVVSSGKGAVHTFTVTYQNQTPGFREAVPYVLAVVELEEGVQVLGNVIGCDVGAVRIGMPVKVTFVDAGEMKVPMFEPV